MGSLNIQTLREEYPGKSDTEAALAFAQKHGYIAIVRYKNSESASDFTNIGTCQSEEQIQGYLRSSYCHDVELIYDGRATALRITKELILRGHCELCDKKTTQDSLQLMAGNDFYICPKCGMMFCDVCYGRLPLTSSPGYGMCPKCRVKVQRAIIGHYGEQSGFIGWTCKGTTEDTTAVTCMACHKRTPVPISNPPFGTPLRCVHCQSPLIQVSEPEEGSPFATSSEQLHRVYGFSGCYLDHPRCPWCQKINCSIIFPAGGRFIGWYAVRNPENPQAFRIGIKCVHCDKDFHVEWDKSPEQRVPMKQHISQKDLEERKARISTIDRFRLRTNAVISPDLTQASSKKKWWQKLLIACFIICSVSLVILLLIAGSILVITNVYKIAVFILVMLLFGGLAFVINYLIENADMREAKRDERNARQAKRKIEKKQIHLDMEVERITDVIRKKIEKNKPLENILPNIRTKDYKALIKAISSTDLIEDKDKGRLFKNMNSDFISRVLTYLSEAEEINILRQIEPEKRKDVLMRCSLSKRARLESAM